MACYIVAHPRFASMKRKLKADEIGAGGSARVTVGNHPLNAKKLRFKAVTGLG
jgi:hypothetical protein